MRSVLLVSLSILALGNPAISQDTAFRPLNPRERAIADALQSYGVDCAGKTLSGSAESRCEQLLLLIENEVEKRSTASAASQPFQVQTADPGKAQLGFSPSRPDVRPSAPTGSPEQPKIPQTSASSVAYKDSAVYKPGGPNGSFLYVVTVQNTGMVNIQCFVHVQAQRYNVGYYTGATPTQSLYNDTRTLFVYAGRSDSNGWAALVPASATYSVECHPS